MGEFIPRWSIGLAILCATIVIPWLAYRHSRKAANQNRAPYGEIIICLIFTSFAAGAMFSANAATGAAIGDDFGNPTSGTIGWVFLILGAGYYTRRTWHEILRVEPEATFRRKHRWFALIAAAAICTVVVYGSLMGIRARHFARIESLLNEFSASGGKGATSKQRFVQDVNQSTRTLLEYIERCRELELALNDYEPYLRTGDRLLGDMSDELQYFKADPKHADLISTISVLQKLIGKDIESARAFRKEVDYARQLAQMSTSEDQIRFYKANILPVKADEKQIANEEVQILTDAKARGVNLPEALYREAGLK